MAREQVKGAVLHAVEDVSRRPGLPELGLEETEALFGDGGKLDSLGLVELVVTVEERISDEIGIDVILADEKALSRGRSPFRTIGSLIDYVDDLVAETIRV